MDNEWDEVDVANLTAAEVTHTSEFLSNVQDMPFLLSSLRVFPV